MNAYRPTREEVLEVLDYDRPTGIFTWNGGYCRMVAGSRAGRLNEKGYRRIRFRGRYFRAHHLAWLVIHGSWPKGRIDHRNGKRDDNRGDNLRLATNAQNSQNRAASRASRSQLLGAHQAWGGRFKSEITAAGVRYQLGTYETAALAHEAYCIAKRVLHTFNPEVRPTPPPPDGYAGAISRELGIKFFVDHRGISLPISRAGEDA